MSSSRVLLLGLDGLGQEFLDSPLVTETAPNLVSLLRDGGVAALPSTFPPYTAPAWTSITTGVGPGRHGVFGFTDADGRPVSDRSVSVPRLWDHVGRAGGRSVVVNMPITHPPRPIDGVLVSGMPVPPGTACTTDSVLAAELESDGYIVDVAVREDGNEGPETLERLRVMTETRGRTAARLVTRETWDLCVVVFVLPDRLGHPWWDYLVPGPALHDTRHGERIRAGARAALAALDEAVSNLLSAVPAGTAVVACSDHGFGSLRGDLFVDVALADAGVVRAPRGAGFLGRIGRSAMGRRLPRAIRELGRSATTGDRGAAWSAPPYECGVRLGDPAIAADVVAVLNALRDPDGNQLVRAIHHRSDMYDGPHVDRAPDLLIELADESVDLHDGFHAPAPWVSRQDVPWGTHRAEGVVAVTGAPTLDIKSAPDVGVAVLDLLGLEPGDAPTQSGTSEYSDDEEAAVLEHLRGLGYVD